MNVAMITIHLSDSKLVNLSVSSFLSGSINKIVIIILPT